MDSRSPLYDPQVAQGAVMRSEARGHPVAAHFGDARIENLSARCEAALFHLARRSILRVEGSDRLALVQRVFTNNVKDAPENSAIYGLVCNREGGVIDDLIVFKRPDRLLLSGNAANLVALAGWLEAERAAESFDAWIEDQSSQQIMMALLGPASQAILGALAGPNLDKAGDGKAADLYLGEIPAQISRSGRQPESGYEIVCDARVAAQIWERLLQAGAPSELRPAGMDAYESLRIESCLPACGRELTPERSPLEAGLDLFIDFNQRFIGRGAIIAQSYSEHSPFLVGFRMHEDFTPQTGCEVEVESEPAGMVTSATASPFLKKIIGMAYVAKRFAFAGGEINIRIQRQRHRAVIVDMPHYSAAGAARETKQ